jgi:hypothetical protein
MTAGGITPAQQAITALIAPALDADTYLAGGVAVALDVGHRTSVDLDLFVSHDFDPERLAERLSVLAPEARVTGRAAGTLHLEVRGVPVSILSYRYPMLAPTRRVQQVSVPVASPQDLACMKVSAIAGRGSAKDFWDLHELLERGVADSLADLLALYRQKYPVEDVGHAVRSLAYFGDADAAPLPNGLTANRWQELKAAMRRRVRAL